MAEPIGIAALVLDAVIGWPDRVYGMVGHPVGGFARAIGWAERRLNRPASSERRRRLLGLATMVGIAGATIGGCLLIERAVRWLLGAWWWIGVALLAWPALAQRSLHEHVAHVATALRNGRLPAARARVAMIVGRDTDRLDEAGIARAAIESLAESFCDGVVAPAFWLLAFGLPGVWTYKAVNTADSLIGHREERWRAFGWAAARTDDLANLIPARVAAVLICLAARRGWRVLWRDCRRHASPNAGWPEAAMAGALGVALAGPTSYDGVEQHKPWIAGEGRAAGGGDIARALRLYVGACALLWLIAGSVPWLR